MTNPDTLLLEPCPFCGGNAHSMVCGSWQTSCSECHAGTPMSFQSRELSEAAWNRRAAPASPLGEGVLPPISFDGPHEIDFHRQWLARQLLDSKLDDEEAYSIVRNDPAIRPSAAPIGAK